VLVCSVNQHDMQHATDQSVVIVPLAIGIVSRWAWDLAPQTFIMDNIFFQNEISIWHLLYTVIHSHLKIYYTSVIVPYDWSNFRRHFTIQVSVFKLFIFTVESCFEQKSAWYRFALVLFKLHKIW